MKRRRVVLFFVLPFAGIFVFFLLASFLNQANIQSRAEELVRDQLEATASVLKRAVGHFLDEAQPAEAILGLVAGDEEIDFVALLDADKNVLSWQSRFEGYLPLSLEAVQEGQTGIIDSPAGKIFNMFVGVPTAGGLRHYLYIGYALTGMEDMIARSRRTAVLFFVLLVMAGAAFVRGLSVLQAQYLAKTREVDSERMEKERYREISAFTSGVAHEIKNPLNSLALLFEILGGKVPPQAAGDVALGRDEVLRIAAIVDRFSSAVRPIRPGRRVFSLDTMLRRVVEAQSGQFPGASSRLSLQTPAPLRALGDEDLLAQAVLNLLRNSLEASPDSRVEIEARRAKRWAEIRIRDSGPGIPPEDLDRVFEPFFTTKESGLGVGLYLAKKIVEANGGAIEAGGREGGGVEFNIRIPEA